MRKINFLKPDGSYLIIFLGLLAYLPLINSYFVLDEWHTFLYYFEVSRNNYFQVIGTFVTPQAGQYLPITQIIAYTIFVFSKINYYSYFLVGMLFHFIVAITLYKLLCLMIKDKRAALIGSLFFVFSPQHFQGTSWVIANIGYFLASIFLLLSIRYFYHWIMGINKRDLFNQILASIFLIFSLLTKDIGLFVVILIPILTFLLTKRFSKLIKSFLIVFPAVFLTIWKYWMIRVHPQVDFGITPQAGILNVFTLPIRALVQSLIPQDLIYAISKIFLILISPSSIHQMKTTLFNQRVESVGALAVVMIISFFVLYVGKLIYFKDRKIFNNYIIGIMISSLSGLSYFFVDSKIFSLLAPRYIYVAVLGISISIASIITVKWKYKRLIFLLTGLYLIFLFISTWRMSIVTAKDNILRKNILNLVSEEIPDGNSNLILLVESDRSYYGLPENIKTVPFQASPAIVFGAYLNKKTHLPKLMAEYNTFQKFDSQGYIYDENGGYGYYWDFDTLKNDLEKYNFKKEYVYAFKYFGDSQTVVNQTDSIRKNLFSN